MTNYIFPKCGFEIIFHLLRIQIGNVSSIAQLMSDIFSQHKNPTPTYHPCSAFPRPHSHPRFHDLRHVPGSATHTSKASMVKVGLQLVHFCGFALVQVCIFTGAFPLSHLHTVP